MATLGTMIIVQGIRFFITKGAPTGDFPPFLSFLGKGDIGPIPVSILSLAIMAAIAAILLNKTVLGRQIYAVGVFATQLPQPRTIYIDDVRLD